MAAKARHWKKFLANSSGVDIFKAFKYTKPTSLGEIAPLYRADKSITSDKHEQANLLFHGTSVAHVEADLSDIPPRWSLSNLDPALDSHPTNLFEMQALVNNLPSKKAAGSDELPNELI